MTELLSGFFWPLGAVFGGGEREVGKWERKNKQNYLCFAKSTFDLKEGWAHQLEKNLIENKGVIKNISLHIKALTDVVNYFKNFEGIQIKGLNFSKIKGAKGNIEYWIYLQKINQNNKEKKDLSYDKMVADVAKKSHEYFLTN